MSRSLVARIARGARRALGAVRTAAARPGIHGATIRSERKTIWKDDQQTLKKTASSWIRFYEYNQNTGILKMYLLSGRVYTWTDVSVDVAKNVLIGNAVCRTRDPSGRSRWVPNKTPSLGAAYWQYLSRHARRAPAAQVQAPFSTQRSPSGRVYRVSSDRRGTRGPRS